MLHEKSSYSTILSLYYPHLCDRHVFQNITDVLNHHVFGYHVFQTMKYLFHNHGLENNVKASSSDVMKISISPQEKIPVFHTVITQ